MKKNKFSFKEFNEFRKTPRGKAIIFFGFYFLLFLFIIISARLNNSSNLSNQKESTSNYKFNFNNIESNNYHFKYTDVFDDNNIIYEGDFNNNVSLFNKSYSNVVENYFYKNGVFLKKDNSSYVMSNNTDILSFFKNIKNILKIIDNSTYVSVTNYQDNTSSYTYQISTTSLDNIINNNKIDIDDIPNTIIIYCDSSNEVYKLEYDLTSYGIYKNLVTKSLKTTLEYSNFNKIDSISDPS